MPLLVWMLHPEAFTLLPTVVNKVSTKMQERFIAQVLQSAAAMLMDPTAMTQITGYTSCLERCSSSFAFW